jgi:translation elongation factor EF-1alpha
MDNQVGQVIHYFNNIGVAVIELSDDLSVGDTVTFVNPNDEEIFEQQIDSMEIDEEAVEMAGSGDEVAVKVKEKAKAGATVHK